jgi:predicted nucleic acid-binding Zn ribbon protein
MPPLIDLAGFQFGRLTVVARAGSDKHGKPLWRCRCRCGREKKVKAALLRRQETLSCGCLQRELSATKLGRCRREEPEVSRAAVEAARFERPCRLCGVAFQASRGEWYCSEECREQKRAVYRRRLRNRLRLRKQTAAVEAVIREKTDGQAKR